MRIGGGLRRGGVERRLGAIADYSATQIVPTLSDWVVGKLVSPLEVTVPPTATSEGSLSVSMGFEFNVHHEDIVGIVRVVYGGYIDAEGNLAWRILDGADPQGVPIKSQTYQPVGTSVPDPNRSFNKSVAIPQRVPTDPTTHFTLYSAALVPIGPTQLLEPLTPQGGFFVPAE